MNSLINDGHILLNFAKNCRVCFVRYKKRPAPKRKPFWAPTAPSKMYNVRKIPEINEEKRSQLVHLYGYYKTNVRSICHYFVEQHSKHLESLPKGKVLSVEDQKNHEERMLWNDAENKRVAALRQERKVLERLERKQELLNALKEKEEQKAAESEKVEEMVRKEKELSKTFVQKDNMDEAIEYALMHPITYEYAIDLNGTILPENAPQAWNESLEMSSSLVTVSYFQKMFPDYIKSTEDENIRRSKYFHGK